MVSIILPLSRHRPTFGDRGRQDQASRRARQVRIRHQQLATQQQPQLKSYSPTPLRTTLRLRPHHVSLCRCHTMFVGRQKYGDEVKDDTMLHGVMREISVPSTANPLPTRSTPFLPIVPRPPVRLYICELYTTSCFLVLLIVGGHSDCPLGT